MALDKVHPLKIELPPDGDDTDYNYTQLDSSEDFVSARGLSFQNSDVHYISTLDNEILFSDPINSDIKLSVLKAKLDPTTHRLLNQLVHGIAENSYSEVTRTVGKVSNITIWTSASKIIKIREWDITRTSGKVSTVTTKQYDDVGSLVETYIETITRDVNNKVLSISGVLS